MDHFLYRDGTLHAEDVPLTEIAAAVGTPVYVYSTATLTRHYRLFSEALTPLHISCAFAVKALSNVAVLKCWAILVRRDGCRVSIGEYARAKAAGVPGNRIVFSGVGKTRRRCGGAGGGIRQFNVESEPELKALSEVAASMGAWPRLRCG